MDSVKSSPGLLNRLPLELREIVYGYLTPEALLPTIIRAQELGVSSVSHRPPPLDLLLVSHQLHAEALDVYYRKCIFKFDGLLDPANVFPLWQIEEILGGTDPSRGILANLRKVELNLFWHTWAGGSVLGDGSGTHQLLATSETKKRIERLRRAVQVLQRGCQLHTVIVTWKEIPASSDELPSDQVRKTNVLQSLETFDGVRFAAGDIVASPGWSRKLLGILERLNHGMVRKKHHDQLRSRAYLDLVEVAENTATEADGHKRTSYFG